jgi:ribosomal protein L40E
MIMDALFPERCERKMCATCGALMPSPAAKCTVCSTFQDWRRYLPFDATVLALLTALVSVIATVAPSFVGWFEGGYSDLTVDYDRDDQSGGIILTAFNAGSIPAHIKKVTLTIPLKNPQGQTSFDGHAVHRSDQKEKEDEDDWFLPPNTHKLITITFDLTTIPPNLSKDDFLDSCTIHFETDEFYPRGTRPSWRQGKRPPDAKIPCDGLSVVRGRH